ncbi:MAG: transporter substrate-binding domain-containing protein [Hyphomicrobiales bacterium]|nr:transporter substrate-binding domain-containing protein [Hyphomicrobiales bacterium]MCP5370195.1 transporter substrate-binding domain-containing protein [Hyphomicrobiales bacterium]
MPFRVMIGLVAVLATAAAAQAREPIDVLVFERAPYYVQQVDGTMSGLVAGPTAQAFDKAQIPFRWRQAAANRHLKILKQNAKPVCATGWFKNAERETFAKFTLPIYRDQPQVALIRTDNRRALGHRTVAALLADRDIRLGRKLGFSYGPKVDGLIDDLRTQTVTTAQDNIGMIRMLVGGSFDVFFVAAEEAEGLVDLLGVARNDVVTVSYEDMPPSGERYILCSRKVDDATIRRLNDAITSLQP